jgi:hypothetical protein
MMTAFILPRLVTRRTIEKSFPDVLDHQVVLPLVGTRRADGDPSVVPVGIVDGHEGEDAGHDRSG